ncbi:TPA: thioredoxin [Candidatus Saccharibacteria bacterium]|nr:thioredoxin [Candidatus Saccharibacteria bacterium]HRJ90866.1 thioredoxin [Candidatus Saccharibacteria bacterium]
MALFNTLTKKEFDEKVLKSDKLVLVDFWAAWCAPCRMMAPALESIAKSMDSDIDVVKVNVEESPENNQLAAEYGVQGIPNMQLFKNGKVVDELIGLRPAPVLEQEVKAALAR